MVTIADQGPGLTPQQQELAFKRYYSDAVDSNPVRGGLGLSIDRRIIELHGREIGVRNRGCGGCEFSFTLYILEKL